jgi:hypothetical protein
VLIEDVAPPETQQRLRPLRQPKKDGGSRRYRHGVRAKFHSGNAYAAYHLRAAGIRSVTMPRKQGTYLDIFHPDATHPTFSLD